MIVCNDHIALGELRQHGGRHRLQIGEYLPQHGVKARDSSWEAARCNILRAPRNERIYHRATARYSCGEMMCSRYRVTNPRTPSNSASCANSHGMCSVNTATPGKSISCGSVSASTGVVALMRHSVAP